MPSKVVAMPVIPARMMRAGQIRSDLSYAKYSQATWKWWCAQRGIEFVVIDQPLGGAEYADMPPTIKRWFAPESLIHQRGKDTRIALVDADTMIRWDAPDFFEEARGFAAVRGNSASWITQSIAAYQHLFPGISLNWWEYFNAGFVMLGEAQLGAIRAFLEFSLANWPSLQELISLGQFGTDQTPLNFIMRSHKERVHFLPPAFNFPYCLPMDSALFAIDRSELPNAKLFADRAFANPQAFAFIERGYVWHFANFVGLRSMVMQEVWRRVCKNYRGIDVDGEDSVTTI